MSVSFPLFFLQRQWTLKRAPVPRTGFCSFFPAASKMSVINSNNPRLSSEREKRKEAESGEGERKRERKQNKKTFFFFFFEKHGKNVVHFSS